MSGLYVPSGYGTLGQLPAEPTRDMTDEEARSWLARRWAAFLDLSRQIVDLQHRAALAARSARERGDLESADAARALIATLGELNQWHNAIVYRADQLGLNVEPTLGAPPLALLGVTALALVVAWFFRRYDAQERALEAIEAGTLSVDEYLQLDRAVGSAPGIGFDWGTLAKWAALALGAYMIYHYVRAREIPFLNPPLVTYEANPAGRLMSRDVVGIWYRHEEDGELYEHRFNRSLFGNGVHMEARPGGDLRLYHRSKPLWREF